jgi:cell division initiation protein
MLSLNDIINASFKKSGFSGYRTDDVDQFIDEVKESYDVLLKKNIEQKEGYESLKAENDQLLEKLKILADKIEDYRTEEDEIKNALVSAQKLGDASIRESRHKAEIIIKDANIKAERIITSAKREVTEQRNELDRLQKTVSDFRSKLLNTYKEHLTLIDALPAQKSEPKAAEEPEQAENIVPQYSEPASNELEVQEPQLSEEIAADEPSDAAFNVQVSNFEEAQPFQPTPSRYSAIQFSNGHDISDDSDSPDGILH